MIKIVNGNILNATEDIIGHQVNCKGVMGAGLAKQIRSKYPSVYIKYKKLCDDEKYKNLLGATQFVDVQDKTIVNMFAQDGYGTSKIQTDYKALKLCLESIIYSVTTDYCLLYNKSVALPFGLGCGLAGGDWKIVYGIIEDVFSDYEVTLYKL